MNDAQNIAAEMVKRAKRDEFDRAAEVIEATLRLIYRNAYLDGRVGCPTSGWEAS